ncbi:alpha/beta hydrolase [Glutamicibacter sp. MNS18]|nr:alpha/beta hydrolase [Glutamicibacter sp. MNS18]
MAADLSQALAILDLQQPVLVGHSGSCLMVRRLALDSPRHVAGLILEASPAAMVEHPAFADFVTGSLALLRDPIDHDFIAQFVRNGATSHAETRRAEEEINDVAKVPAHVWQRLSTGMLEYDDRADLPRITCPVLLLWGDADPLVDGSVQQRRSALMPRARLVIFPGAGHSPRLDSPQRFADEVAHFMSQLDR